MDYQQAIDYIHSINRFGVKLGLENIKKLLELMGNPHKELKFIHVAGTNGKGSTCAFINQMLIEAGYKVGLYTSPYLEFFNERIKINNKPIDDLSLAELTCYVKDKIECMIKLGYNHPTEFEVVTAIAFEYFKRQKVDFVVLEVGLGGRFDATNVIDKPELCIITSIGYDHMELLGDSIEDIAFEKAGIIKQDTDVILGIQKHKSVIDVIKKVSEENTSRLVIVENDCKIVSNTLDGIIFDCYTEYGIYKNLEIHLLGYHQIQNALNCIYAYEILSKKYQIGVKSLIDGLMNARWNGRFEIISKEPLIILDGAHNKDGVEVLKKNCEIYLNDKKISVIFGVLKDKEYDFMINTIKEITDEIIFTLVPYQKRSFSAKEANDLAAKHNLNFIYDYKTAIDMAIKNLSGDSALIVCGSLYLVGPVRHYLTLSKSFS